MSWQEELSDYIGRINDKAYDRLVAEWPPERTYPPGGANAIAAEREFAELAEIHTNFDRFADGHPASCEHMKEKLENVRLSLLAHINDDITDVRDVIADWHDPVANAFRDYLGECETAVMWRIDYVEAMTGIAELQQEILARTRQDVRRIADALLEALDQPVDEGFDFSLGDAFALAGAVAAVVLAVMTPIPGDEAAAVVVALELTSRVKQVFDAGAEAAEALSVPAFEGRRTIDILASAYDALDSIATAVAQQEHVVVDGLTKLYDGFVENEGKFGPRPQPVDINAVDPNEVRTIDPDGIRTAARDNLPTVAGDNRAAALYVAAIEENEPYAFEGELHSQPCTRWQARREDLQRTLGDTATALEDMAAKLEAIASTYSATETAQVQGFGNISRRLENV